MKLLLSSLLLASLCALSSWSVSSTGASVVTQTPDVTVREGETVNISCCWTGISNRMTINWKKNQTEVKKDFSDSKNSTEESVKNESKYCSYLTLNNISTKDSGTYICEVNVEIPAYAFYRGNGTMITLIAEESRGGNTKNSGHASVPIWIPMITSLVVVVALLLITLVCFCNLRRRQAQAARVIYEVPHTDSEVAEMDKHSPSSSRGSSQWCQVPVYESFDYFERVQTKESG